MTKDRLSQFIGNHNMTIVDAMEMIDKNSSGILFVINEQNVLVGCISDGDIRRWLIKTGELNAAVYCAMTKNPRSVTVAEKDTAYNIMLECHITGLPVLNENNEIMDIILRSDFDESTEENLKKSLNGVPVVIMAGGKGTRLYPYTKILPKPLIPIGDTPIVERIMNYYTEYGIYEFYMTVNYKREMIHAYFSDGYFPFHIKYVEEDKPLGTGGSLKLIEDIYHCP